MTVRDIINSILDYDLSQFGSYLVKLGGDLIRWIPSPGPVLKVVIAIAVIFGVSVWVFDLIETTLKTKVGPPGKVLAAVGVLIVMLLVAGVVSDLLR